MLYYIKSQLTRDHSFRSQIRPIVEAVFPFTELPAAYSKVSARHNRGKTVLDMKEPFNIGWRLPMAAMSSAEDFSKILLVP